MQPNHIPRGDPCDCGKPANKHKVSHTPTEVVDNICGKCGLSVDRHYVVHIPSGDPCVCGVPYGNHLKRCKGRNRVYYVGLDGEGQGQIDHKYILLCAADESGRVQKSIHNPDGLSTIECLEFILGLPGDARPFAYSFNYDLTKILKDLPDILIYGLFHPELRQRKVKLRGRGYAIHNKPMPVEWEGYLLNLQGTKFTIEKGKKKKTVWDIFKFYSTKFVNALKDWKVGDPEVLKRMEEMKNKRSEFDKESLEDITSYCYSECRYIAELVRKLVEAHEAIHLNLTSFYSAGSSASAMLNAMEIRDKIAKVPAIDGPVASAFFGGRFENSVIGTIPGPIYNYDISSAYPYQLCFLPCLLHGHWENTTDRNKLLNAANGVVKYRLNGSKSDDTAWGPFPYRMKDGTICFPKSSGGGWIWRDEYLAGEKLFRSVEFIEAWIYEQNCDCSQFPQIPGYYKERIRIGKEGAGIAIKLGLNSCYGKLAQSVGNAPYNSWIWAGLITSNTRAQILELLALHQDRSNMLMVATDGIYAKERLVTPYPKDTQTWECMNEHGKLVKKPLGGWEEKIVKEGVFVARPGVYFPLNPTIEQIKDIRARGVGKGVLLENWRRIIDSYEQYGAEQGVYISNISRFSGAKSSISKSGDGKDTIFKRSEKYGQWFILPVEMTFNPLPKRECIEADKISLRLREMPMDTESMPYTKSIVSPEAISLKITEEMANEQPDGMIVYDQYGE